jgi:hypothetical protein
MSLARAMAFAESVHPENSVSFMVDIDLNGCVASGVAFGIEHTSSAEHACNPRGNIP